MSYGHSSYLESTLHSWWYLRRGRHFVAFGWTETQVESNWMCFLILFLIVDLVWRLGNSIHLNLQSWQCLSLCLHMNEKEGKKPDGKICHLSVFSPFSKSEISPWKWCFLSLNPTNKMKFTYPGFYCNCNFRKIQNIEYFIEIWTLDVTLMFSVF